MFYYLLYSKVIDLYYLLYSKVIDTYIHTMYLHITLRTPHTGLEYYLLEP